MGFISSPRVRIPSSPPLYSQNTPTTPILRHLIEFVNNSDNFTCPTFVQQKFLSKPNFKDKYLYKRNNIFYFSKRINGKPYKISLHSNNLEYCRMLRNKIIEELSTLKTEQEEFFELRKLLKNSNHYLVDAKLDMGRGRRKIFDIISTKDFERIKKEADGLKQTQAELYDLKHNTSAGNTIDIQTLTDKVSQLENNLLAKINSLESNSFQNNQSQTNNQEVVDLRTDIYANLDKYYELYVEHKKSVDGISQYSVKSYNSSMKYLKYFVNEECDFSFKFFKELQKKLQKIPKNFFKYPKYYEKTFEELIVIKEKDNYDTLDNKTINKHIINWKNFFKYLKYEEYINENPLADILALSEEKKTNKEEYTGEELDRIFSSNMGKEYLNMCRVALYSGLRIEEVLSIKKKNIKDNSIHIDLEDSSSKKHQRIIPIHRNLVPIIEYQKKSNKGNYIFFNGNLENEVKNVGKRINRRLKNIVPIEEKTFHSFRKNFSQNIELNSDSEDKIKKYLMGHSQNKDITHAVYNRGKINIDKLVSCINDIDFEY